MKMITKETLEVEEIEGKEIFILKHNVEDEVEPAALLKIINELEQGIAQNQKYIDGVDEQTRQQKDKAEKDVFIFKQRLEKLAEAGKKATLWIKKAEMEEQRKKKDI